MCTNICYDLQAVIHTMWRWKLMIGLSMSSHLFSNLQLIQRKIGIEGIRRYMKNTRKEVYSVNSSGNSTHVHNSGAGVAGREAPMISNPSPDLKLVQ